tara:strand:- start:417 stop:593 length:177 start_codon:yes stop_codon:yes gene_type:complete
MTSKFAEAKKQLETPLSAIFHICARNSADTPQLGRRETDEMEGKFYLFVIHFGRFHVF